jgi:hypothetical protein
MFLARDRNRFFQEIRSLPGAKGNNKPVAEERPVDGMAATNEALEHVIRPLFEAYADMVRKAGRTCDYKVFQGSYESHPPRAAFAEFWLDLTDVPGVAQYFMRFESDGQDWVLLSRPALDRASARHETGELVIPADKKLDKNIEGVLQQFIRLTF